MHIYIYGYVNIYIYIYVYVYGKVLKWGYPTIIHFKRML